MMWIYIVGDLVDGKDYLCQITSTGINETWWELRLKMITKDNNPPC